MADKVKIGAFFLGGEYFWQAGVIDDTTGRFAGFAKKVEEEVASIIQLLQKDYEVVSSGILHGVDQVVNEAQLFNRENVQAVVFCPIIWTDDQPLLAFIQEVHRTPLIMWAYCPYLQLPDCMRAEELLHSTGTVSVQQASNIFKRYHWDYQVVLGNEQDPEPMREIKSFLKAVEVAVSLKGTRIGVLPSPCRVVVSTLVDEMFLREKFGVELTFIPIHELDSLIQSTTLGEASEYTDYLKSKFPAQGISDETLQASARQALAMARLIDEHHLSGIALEDFNDDIYKVLKFRPHLYHPKIGELGAYIGLEADVSNTLSTIIACRLSGNTGMFNELLVVDKPKGTFIMGHPGPFDFSLADPDTFSLTRDLEFDSAPDCGAWVGFRLHEGFVTLLNFTPEYGKLKVAVFQGNALKGPKALEGYVHSVIKPNRTASELYKEIVERGLIQHWGTTYGDILPELKCFMNILDLNLEILTPESI